MSGIQIEHAGYWRFDGDYITQSVICVYCDRCGSFRITRDLIFKIIIGIAGIASSIYAMRNLSGFEARVIYVVSCFLILLWVLTIKYRCKACGNLAITHKKNVLNYPSYNKSILDVPFEKTVRFIADDY